MTSYDVYCLYISVNSSVNNKKKFKRVYVKKNMYNNSNVFIKKQIKRIYNDIENNFYSIIDFILIMYYISIFGKIDLKKIDKANISEMKEVLTKDRIKKDIAFIKRIQKKLKFKNVNKFIIIDRYGNNYLYNNLVLNKYISPITYMSIVRSIKVEEVNEKNSNIKKFENIVNNIKMVINSKGSFA